LSRFADERQTLRIFVRTRSLAHKHQPRIRVAIGKYKFVAPLMQNAACAIANLVADDLQCGNSISRRYGGSNLRRWGNALAWRNGWFLSKDGCVCKDRR